MTSMHVHMQQRWHHLIENDACNVNIQSSSAHKQIWVTRKRYVKCSSYLEFQSIFLVLVGKSHERCDIYYLYNSGYHNYFGLGVGCLFKENFVNSLNFIVWNSIYSCNENRNNTKNLFRRFMMNMFRRVIMNMFRRLIMNMFRRVIMNMFLRFIMNMFRRLIMDMFRRVIMNMFLRFIMKMFRRLIMNMFRRVIMNMFWRFIMYMFRRLNMIMFRRVIMNTLRRLIMNMFRMSIVNVINFWIS